MLKTVDDACDFILEWCREKGNHAGQSLNNEFAVPGCIERLNTRIGELWSRAEPLPGPVLRYPTPFLGVLGGQDQILNPNSYSRDEDGIVPFVWENQAVWGFGFDPNDPDQLMVTGDWHDGPQRNFKTGWRRVAANTEDALVCTLLTNLCMQSDATWNDADKPDTARIVLWQHPAWDDYYKLRTNDERTLICFDRWQVIRR